MSQHFVALLSGVVDEKIPYAFSVQRACYLRVWKLGGNDNAPLKSIKAYLFSRFHELQFVKEL